MNLSKRMMNQYKDGVYRMSRNSVAKHVAKLEDENATMKAATERLSAEKAEVALKRVNEAFRISGSHCQECIEARDALRAYAKARGEP